MPAIFMRPATLSDRDAIMMIIEAARKFLASQHIPQWQGSYPDNASITADITAGNGRVLMFGDQIAGYAALIQGPDPHYAQIEGPGWIQDRAYFAIHRFALSDRIRGQHLSTVFLSQLLTESLSRGVDDIRVDTHAQNVIMQHVLDSMGFVYRGIVLMDEPIPERYAYQLILSH